MFKRKEKNITTTAPINLTTINEPMSVITEQIKTIRTNINFAATDHKLRTLMVTSAMLGEGKTFGLKNHKGLSSWLANQIDDVNDAIHPVIGNL